METLTLWFYTILKLDDLKTYLTGGNGWTFFIGIALLAMTAILVICVICRYCFDKYKHDSEEHGESSEYNFSKIFFDNKAKYVTLYLFFIGIMMIHSFVVVLIPSTKQAMALVTIDLVLKNKDQVIETGADLFDIVDKKVEKYLKLATGEIAKETAEATKGAAKAVGKEATEAVDRSIDKVVEGAKSLKELIKKE